jgi:hypothetical protein
LQDADFIAGGFGGGLRGGEGGSASGGIAFGSFDAIRTGFDERGEFGQFRSSSLRCRWQWL